MSKRSIADIDSSGFLRCRWQLLLLWPAALLGVVLSARNIFQSMDLVAAGPPLFEGAAGWVPLVECRDNGTAARGAGGVTDAGTSQQLEASADSHRRPESGTAGPFLWGAAPQPHGGGGDGSTDHADNDDECWIAFQRIRQINDCFRMSAGAARDANVAAAVRDVVGSTGIAVATAESCATHHNLSQPLLNWAWYAGQGYGRLVEHSVNTCLVAAVVGRPCLVDMTERDPYHIFRSFVSSTLDVEVDEAAADAGDGSSVLSRVTSREILDALSRLPELHNGHWTAGHLNGTGYRYILPLLGTEGSDGPSPPTPLQQLLSHPEKVAISPNWGTAWFGNSNVTWPPLRPSLLSASAPPRTCLHTDPRLVTYMQNYMYRPTALARGLHREYHRKVMGGGVNGAAVAADGVNRPDSNTPPYGAIQLRFVILQLDRTFPNDDQDADTIRGALHKLALDLLDCLRGQQMEALAKADSSWTSTFIQRWWIVTDKIGLGKNFTDMINQMAVTNGGDDSGKNSTDGRKNSTDGKMEFYFDDSSLTSSSSTAGGTGDGDAGEAINRINRHRVGGVVPHSMDRTSVGPMGHEYMASSIIDWMVLHESKMALITTGAFAATGARGQGKVPLSKAEAHDRCSSYVVFT